MPTARRTGDGVKIGISVGGYDRRDIAATAAFVAEAERLGAAYAWSAEAWAQDAATTLAYIAARTERIVLGTGIMQISARAPSMTAMTALSLHALSGRRFVLGLGASGPQVVEGLHGVPYRAPLGRLRETVEIVRMACRGETLRYAGRHHTLPLPGGEGKALRLDHPPARIPVFLATLAPRALEYTGAAADGWLGTSFSPDHAEAHLAHLRRGAEAAGRSLGDIALHAACPVAIGDDVAALAAERKPAVAFTMGAMGSARTNFYKDAYARAGYADDAEAVQRLWRDGKREAAAARVPDAMVTRFGAFGPPAAVRDRLRRYRAAGIDALTVRLDGPDDTARLALLEQVLDLARGLDAAA